MNTHENQRKSMKFDDDQWNQQQSSKINENRWYLRRDPKQHCLSGTSLATRAGTTRLLKPLLGVHAQVSFWFLRLLGCAPKTNTKRSGISHILWTLIFYSILHAITIHWDCHVNSYILPPHVQILCFILACFRYGSEFLCYTCVSSLYDPNMKKLTKAEQKLSKAKQS